MNRMEQRIQAFDKKPYCPTDERIEEIKQCAFEEYDRFLRVNAKRNKRKKRGVLRGSVAIAALAVCFLIVSFAYSILAPVTIADANGFVRRTAIWINNQLQLGITFSSPIENIADAALSDEHSISTIGQLKSVAAFPIIYIPESDEIRIERIDLNTTSSNQQETSIWYATIDNKSIVIRNEPLYESNSIGIQATSLKGIDTAIGTVYIWIEEEKSYAMHFSESSIMYLSCSAPIAELEKYAQLLTYLR